MPDVGASFEKKGARNFGSEKQLPIPLHYKKGPYFPKDGAFWKHYWPFSTRLLPESVRRGYEYRKNPIKTLLPYYFKKGEASRETAACLPTIFTNQFQYSHQTNYL